MGAMGVGTDDTGVGGDEGSPSTAAAGGTLSLPLERKRAVIEIMKEAFKSYHLAWARPSIEPAFKVRVSQHTFHVNFALSQQPIMRSAVQLVRRAAR